VGSSELEHELSGVGFAIPCKGVPRGGVCWEKNYPKQEGRGGEREDGWWKGRHLLSGGQQGLSLGAPVGLDVT